MYLVQVFAILLVLSLSTQNVLKFKVFDDITQKCQDAVSDHTEEIQDCNIKLELKWQDKIIKDVNNTKSFEKDICDLIKDKENQCNVFVKVNYFNSM